MTTPTPHDATGDTPSADPGPRQPGNPSTWAGVPAVVPPGDRTHRRRMSPEYRAAYLAALERTGVYAAAARAVGQHTGGRTDGSKPPTAATWDALRRDDPSFKAACEEALSRAAGWLAELMRQRIETPDERPIVDKSGKVVAVAKDFRNANALLLRALERADSSFVQRKNVSTQGEISHVHRVEFEQGDGHFKLLAADIARLDPADQDQLLGLLEKLEDIRSRPALPASQPPEIVFDDEPRPIP
jgi:hypothetical protein